MNMTTAFLLAPIPKWVLINNEGTVAGGARLYTYRSLNKIQPKAVYQDAGGTIPWNNPIIFNLNGVQGPFYWKVDSADLSDTYYLEAYDSNGNLLWTQDDYFPSGSGGGGNVTTYVPLQNYITNNQFIDHMDGTSNPILSTTLVVAPSNHKGFTPSLINPVTGLYGTLGPDILFVKSNINATDQITFPLFDLATAPLTGDVTPVNYVRYLCTNNPIPAEDYKCFQFPITQKVKNLSNQDMSFQVWARVAPLTTPVTITAYLRQYFGSGTAASADVRGVIGAMALDTNWTKYTFNFTVPDVAGKSIGNPGEQTDDDAVYVQLEMPLGQACDVWFIKPTLYLGTINPDQNFDTYDQINSINLTQRTGEVRASYLSSMPGGWVRMNDGSIGNVGSLATIRRNADTFQLFKTLWDSVSQPTANVYATVSGGLGVSAVADFIANKTLTLPRALGMALASAGNGALLTPRVLGSSTGEESHQLTIAEMPSHNHPGSTVNIIISGSGLGAGNNTVIGSGTTAVNVAAQGGGQAHNNMQPTTFMNFFIKL